MDKNMKKSNYVILIVLGIISTVILILLLRIFIIRDENPSISVDSAFLSVSNSESVFCKINDTYYKVDVSKEFIDLFQKDSWIDLNSSSGESTEWITLRIAELYEIYLYSDRKASIFYGYSDIFHKTEAYYTVPSEVFKTVKDYITSSGSILTSSDGIGKGTFLK